MPSDMSSQENKKELPFWTWLVPLPIFFLGTLISLEAKITNGTSLFYFPLPFALTLAYWWGPRVLPAFYINAVACAGLWGLERIALWPLYGLPEVVFVFLSWLFFVKLYSGKIWLPDTTQIVYFLILGILGPLIPYKLMLELIFMFAGDAPSQNYWNLFITTGFGDFVSTFCVSIPLLFFLTRPLWKKGLVVSTANIETLPVQVVFTTNQWVEFGTVSVIVYLMNSFLSFHEYWFLNGIISLYVAMRFGFGATVMMNSFILSITYLLPVALYKGIETNHFLESSMLKTQLGTALLYVFTIITGRLVTDMRVTEKVLNEQNQDLNKMNTELDRFVYSVSHDLSAPLKSIRGLVYISRLTDKESDHRNQFDLIEKSVNKLEYFVSEVLDYSRTKRSEPTIENIDLKALAIEIYDGLKFSHGFDEIHFDLDGIKHTSFATDRSRLKIILQNILSNAIKFRQNTRSSFVKISTSDDREGFVISIKDNGQGIESTYLPKVFDMFFRASENSKGSGLGLYIAQEAAKMINAKITVDSTYGSGSEFRIVFERKME